MKSGTIPNFFQTISLFFIHLKPDSPPLGLRRGHEFPDGVEDHLELRVVFLFQGLQLTGQVRMGSQNPAQTDKGSHDLCAAIALGEWSTLESMATPCSVKA